MTRPTPTDPRPVPTRRFAMAWALMVGGLVGFWSCRRWMGLSTFQVGQIVVLLVSWKAASLLCLPGEAWSRFTRLRLFAYCVWVGMQPRQFLKGQETAPGAPLPTVRGFLLNVLAGAVLFRLVPRFLPDSTPWAVRFGVGLVGFVFLFLIARFDFWALVFRAMGFAVEKLWDCPVAATSLGDFWGRRWNRVVSGFLREVVFLPLSRRVGPGFALFAVFLYSGFYHEIFSVMAGSGPGGPTFYFLVQYLGVAAENGRLARRWLRAHPRLGRAWTFAVVALPAGLFLHPGVVDRVLVPMLERAGFPGLAR